MRAALAALLLATAVGAGAAEAPPGEVTVQGGPDGGVPGWVLHARAPSGWTADCCAYARAIGVNLVMYQGEWSGEPDRVMVLNVWPRELPSLDAELDADRKRYLQRDPAARVGRFPVRHRGMACEAQVFEGSDGIDDAVVFCEPGRAAGVRLSWSVSFHDADPRRAALLADFMQVVVGTRYRRGTRAPR
ncbi:hypothetical protein [Fulvimonas yonginensis]|uniref:Uncharacterized protein n=1 Tax=Fulvimonas yonginensis TaxID=1495200 RepID=A0ABU8J7R2_9GAMM